MSTYQDERGNTVSSVDTSKVVQATPEQARQGLLGRPVLLVLIGGLLLALAAWAIAGQYGASLDNKAGIQTNQTTMPGTDTTGTPAVEKPVDAPPQTGDVPKVQ